MKGNAVAVNCGPRSVLLATPRGSGCASAEGEQPGLRAATGGTMWQHQCGSRAAARRSRVSFHTADHRTTHARSFLGHRHVVLRRVSTGFFCLKNGGDLQGLDEADVYITEAVGLNSPDLCLRRSCPSKLS